MSNLIYPVIRGLDVTILKEPAFQTIVQASPSDVETRIAQSQNPIWTWTLAYNYLKNNPNDIPPGYAYTDLQQLMGFFMGRQGRFDDFLFDDTDDDFVGPALATNTWPGAGKKLPLGYSILDSSNRWQKVTTAGTTGGSLPTFTGTTTSDGTVTWTSQGTYSASGYPNPQAQLSIVNSGGVNYSPLQRNMGGQFLEDITDLNTTVTALQVYSNGTLKTGGGTDFSLLGPGLTLAGSSYQGLYLQWVTTPTAPVTATFQFYQRVRFDMDAQDFEKFLALVWEVGGPHAKNSSGMVKLRTSRAPTL